VPFASGLLPRLLPTEPYLTEYHTAGVIF